MIPRAHGGKLIDLVLKDKEREEIFREVNKKPHVSVSQELATDVQNIAIGAFSPLEGFMGKEDFQRVLYHKRLTSGVPWTIPIVIDVSQEEADRLGDEVVILFNEAPIALFQIREKYTYKKEEYAKQTFGTTDTKHPGVAKVMGLKDVLLGGKIRLISEVETPFSRYSLKPIETRVLFEAKGWKTVVGFQTRNVPHLGHEYVQKTALTFVDGIYINPVIGRKKAGDFKDEAILRAYESLIEHYYPKERAVMSILQTEMRYAGPREAIFHAIVRKNFGCTHFIVGRDHAGVGNFYAPYAAQEIFDEFPDLGITPLFFTAFFYCTKCGSVVNEKICPHGEKERLDFSGTFLRQLLLKGEKPPYEIIRQEVADSLRNFKNPFIE